MTGECGWQQRKAVISTPFELLDSTVVDQRQPGFLGSVLLLTKGYKSQGSMCVCVGMHMCAHVHMYVRKELLRLERIPQRKHARLFA